MRVKHPDTFTCDICGADMVDERKVTIPVLHDLHAIEWGTGQNSEPEIRCSEFDLCDECLRKVTVIRERPVFCGASKYEFIDGGAVLMEWMLDAVMFVLTIVCTVSITALAIAVTIGILRELL